MLESLHVHNFALLEDAQVSFVPGFNVFTGETGAGKSILIDAFSLLLGSRASVDYVRSGTDGFWVQAVFDISGIQSVRTILLEQGIELEDELFIKRSVSINGKSRAYINGVQVPAAILKKIANLLVDIHGQHENQELLEKDYPRILTDRFAGQKISGALSEYQAAYELYKKAQRDLDELLKDSEQRDILLDRYKWEINEIKSARLIVNEEVALEEEAKILQHSEKIIAAVTRAYDLLDNDRGVLSLLADAKNSLHNACRYDERLDSAFNALDSAWINVDDTKQSLAEYLDNLNFNGQRAAEVQERLDVIYRLQKKYGGTTEDVLAYLASAEEKYNVLLDVTENIATAQNNLQKLEQQLSVYAGKLTQLRKQAASELSKEIAKHIHDLAMPNAELALVFSAAEKYGIYGADNISFMFSANIGEPMNELEKVASGGELSRIALAVKTVMRNMNDIPTMVFDEIDTGVGGVTARKMAEKISTIAVNGQVLCITHLPQIAAFADRHIHISKHSEAGRTFTDLQVLNDDERVREIARMASGSTESESANANALELLRDARKMKIGVYND